MKKLLLVMAVISALGACAQPEDIKLIQHCGAVARDASAALERSMQQTADAIASARGAIAAAKEWRAEACRYAATRKNFNCAGNAE